MREERTKVVTIQDLATAFNSLDHLAYKNMLKEEQVSERFRAALTNSKDKQRYPKNLENQQNELEIIEKVIMDYDEEKAQHQKEYDWVKEKYEHAKKIYESAKRIMAKKQYEMKVAEVAMRSEEAEINDAERNKQEMQELLAISQRKLEQMKKFVLIHPTATLGSVDRNVLGVLVATKFDVKRLKYKRFADEVIDTTNEDIDIPEGTREKFETEEEFQSAVEYAKLVVKYWAEDKPCELLYNSEGIKYMLEQIFK